MSKYNRIATRQLKVLEKCDKANEDLKKIVIIKSALLVDEVLK